MKGNDVHCQGSSLVMIAHDVTWWQITLSSQIDHKGLSCVLIQLIDGYHNQQNILCLYPFSDDKTSVIIKWAINKLKLNWTEQFETCLIKTSPNYKDIVESVVRFVQHKKIQKGEICTFFNPIR